MSIYAFAIQPNNNAFSPIVFDKVIHEDYINKLVEQATPLPTEKGSIVRNDAQHETHSDIRNVTVRYLPVSDEFGWLYDMISQYVNSANNDYFKYNITGFMEGMQFLHYGDDIGGGHYNWHLDVGANIATRKLTVILQLSDPDEYEGCDTEVMFNNNVDKRKGAITIFPSWLPHRVTQLTKGNRNALVAWVNGPTFR